MTTIRESSSDTTDNVISGGAQLPSHTVARKVTVDAQEKKCHFCRQDRQKCEWEEGREKCERCEKLKYICAIDIVASTADASRRTLRFEKCSFCRQSRQKCLPVDRLWPARCDRCVSKGLACSENLKKNAEPRRPATNGTPAGLKPSSHLSTAGNSQRLENSSERERAESRGHRYETTHGETSQRDYGYAPLISDEFRVLELHPGSGKEEIVCELRQWDGKVQYEAVSYLRSFNERIPITMLTLGGKRLKKPIMPNLEAALRHLRLPDLPRILWVNAICIDHSNTYERNDQVHVVPKIFNQASKVCLWLGEMDGSTCGDVSTAFDFAVEILSPNAFDEATRDVKSVSKWKSLLDLISHPLFERRWIVQEVAVARHVTMHYGISEMNWADFSDVVTMFEHAEKRNQVISRLFKQSPDSNHHQVVIGDVQALGASRFISLTSHIFKKSNSESNTGDVTQSLLSLENLVYRLASFKGWDPHDVIYACVSLSQESRSTGFSASEPPPYVRKAADKFLSKLDRKVQINEKAVALRSGQLRSLPQAVTSLLRSQVSDLDSKREIDTFLSQRPLDRVTYNVNYELPVPSTYKEFIAHVMRESKSLGILCRPWAPPKQALADYFDDGVPSWIATLDRAAFGKSPTSPSYLRINADPLIGPPDEETYKASLDLPASWSFPDARSGRNRLHVDGFELTTISETRTEAIGGIIPPKWLQFVGWDRRDAQSDIKIAPIKREGILHREMTQEEKPTKDPNENLPPDSLWRTLVADRGPNGNYAPVFYRRACQYAFKQSGVASAINTEQLLDAISLPIVKEFLQRVQEVVWNRQLIKTKRGYLGLAPEAAEKGDLVCILYGCSVPVVIREVEGVHELIGECYIHGMMDGAALSVQISENIPKKTFCLQ